MWTIFKLVRPVRVMALVLTLNATSQAGTLIEEDFESGATGWTDNTTTDSGHADFTRFLGRFEGTDGNQDIWKMFSLPGNQAGVRVQFDFYQLDSWDNENFVVYIDDVEVANDMFSHGASEDPANATPLGPNEPQVFESWNDQRFRYEFEVPVTDTDVKVGFGSTLILQR